MWQMALNFCKSDLFCQIVVNFSLKIVGVLFGFLLTLVVARYIEISVAGDFFFLMSLGFIIGTVFKFGLDQSTIRFVSTSDVKSHAHINIMQSVLLISIIFTSSLLFLCLTFLYLFHNTLLLFDVYVLVVINAIFWALFNLIAMGFQGLSFSKTSVFFMNICSNALFLIFFILLRPTSLYSLLFILLCSSAFCFLLSYLFFFRQHLFFFTRSIDFTILRSSIPLFFVSILGQLLFWGGQLFLGLFESSESVAIFAVCQRLSLLVSFVLTTTNFILSPKIARFAAAGNFKDIELLCKKGIVITSGVSFPVFVFIFFFPDLLLNMFGTEYVIGTKCLLILIIGQAINVFFGPVIYILSMSGFEKDLTKCSLLAGATLVLASLLLIDAYGIEGAAIATILAIFVQTFLASFYVKYRLNIFFYRLS
ncbi:hypothetical protein FJ444_20165 [Aestuariibacter sp. GS-14]|uniref:oligosaccharide flippase family protein n=1 Tax=Aestuariibacter sp. GS-14 TaxID=2590670 RepID=UPI001129AD9C|nr:oligosaccharide flippase family protein [Aestuariibacter sp. GS-14]TPV53847.1 hypothetical protein FJ444_20165 [Aestuariibacter sp. GS-14]